MIESNPVQAERGQGVRLAIAELLVLVAALTLALALPSWADQPEEGATEAAAPAEAAGPEYVPCSELGQAKYPFLRCVRGPSGRPVLAEEGPGIRGARLELGSSFAAGAGGWGASGIE